MGAERSGPAKGEVLDLVPLQNTSVRAEARGNAVVLWVPLNKRWWMRGPLSWLLPFRREKGVELDALGREVWNVCDGERTLEQIVEEFAQRHKLGFHEARLSVQSFVALLLERNLIVLTQTTGAVGGAEPGERGGVAPPAAGSVGATTRVVP